MARYEITQGSLEWNEWRIETDVGADDQYGSAIVPCRHAQNVVEQKDGSGHTNRRWIVPRVVRAESDDRYCITQVCLDCILEAAQALADGKLQQYVEPVGEMYTLGTSGMSGSVVWGPMATSPAPTEEPAAMLPLLGFEGPVGDMLDLGPTEEGTK